jgi:hypothetical protein
MEKLKYRVELSDASINPLFNEPFKYVHPAIDMVDGIAYVGVTIPCQIRDSKGRETVKDILALVTSDRRIIFRHKEVLAKEKIRLRHDIPKVMSRWSLRSVKDWLDGNAYVDPLDVYVGVRTAFEEFIELEDDTTYDFLTLWTIGTYFFHLFPAYSYIYVGGIKQTGKTKLLTILERLCFNAKNSIDLSGSALFRNVEVFRTTLLIDEADVLDSPERKQEIRKLLWGGYKRGSLVDRTNPNTFQPEWFEVYSPKAIANIKGIEDILEDRCIVLIMKRGKRKEIVNREIPFDAEVWQDLRDKLYVFYLTYAKEIKELAQNFSFSEGCEVCEVCEGGKGVGLEKLAGRERELWSPILKLALFFNRYINGLYEKMVDFAVRKSQEKFTENVTETAEYILAKTLTELVKADDYYKVKDIRELMASKYDEEQKWLSNAWVGRAMKRLGFMDKRQVGTGVEYLLRVAQVRDLAERLGIKNEGEIEAVVVDMQTWIKAVYESFRKHYIQSFNNVEFYHYFVDKFGVPKEEATKLLKQLKNDNLIFATYQGSWVWT